MLCFPCATRWPLDLDGLLRMRPQIEGSQHSCKKDFFASHERDTPDFGRKPSWPPSYDKRRAVGTLIVYLAEGLA
ncbi:hypothetical protein GJ744_003122 [Endocarpon pusillum]|uniref:Uncharacterized protein n=1 Tax=Endocarpon pusillum TaxID=364733 RepID=A0A8H7APE0_9EURO|nr:hypothetical protein GJ744_003122 [Endocarpon pusillum]